MKKYEIVIIDYNLIDAIALKNIITKSCMNLINVNYFISLEEAVFSINKNKPDIIILDIMLRNEVPFNFYKLFQLNGIKILFTAPKKSVFLSPADKKAFDYIYKPYKEESVILSINKALNADVKTDYIDTEKQFDLVTIASLDKIDVVDPKDIVFCGAEGKYTTFHLVNGRKIMSSKNLGTYEKVLNDALFFRVHHSYIINIKHLTSVVKNEGTFCKLVNGSSIPIAKRKQGDFNRFIRIN